MDINEVKKFIQDKIETDKLTQKVRTIIKEKKWEKQDLKEGFKESFKPLIKPQQELNKQIREQNEENNEQIQQIQQNQLALTEGLAANRLALTQGLDTMAQLLALEQGRDKQEPFDDDDQFEDSRSQPSSPITEGIPKKTFDPSTGAIPKYQKLIPDMNLTAREVHDLTSAGFVRPTNLINLNKSELDTLLDRTNKVIRSVNGEVNGLNRKKNKTKEEEKNIREKTKSKEVLIEYKKVVQAHITALHFKHGSGVYFNNPHQLLNRLELLAGSILAGNNGVIPEFSQLIHFLNQINVISKKQLNDLLKNYLNIR